MMKKLLSLPPNLVGCFHEVEQLDRNEWYCTSDPDDRKVGSGGGTAWLLKQCCAHEHAISDFDNWLSRDKRILLHAGGQSRRLPGYAPSGKVLIPIPVFRWSKGQRLKQNLLSLQVPLYEKIMEKAPDSLHTLIASGDVYIRSSEPLQPIPDVDVVCYGLWADPSLAKNHGVFVADRQSPDELDYMLQKPSVEELGNLMQTHLFLMDIGVWLLSDRAVKLLCKRSENAQGEVTFYDLYSEFGLALGKHPRIEDDELNRLSVAVLPLPGGEFYHYGTSNELIASTLKVQNLVNDQRAIMHYKVKPNPAMFVQNAHVLCELTKENAELWIENAWIGRQWKLHRQHIVTGVPRNDWTFDVPAGVCVDVVMINRADYAARPYGFYDTFKGKLCDESTFFMGRPFTQWLNERALTLDRLGEGEGDKDIQSAALFPICKSVDDLELMLRWMVSEPDLIGGKERWLSAERLSADQLSAKADLRRLYDQRMQFRAMNWPVLAANYEKSVFYQLDLNDAAAEFNAAKLSLPKPLPDHSPLMTRIHDAMFRAKLLQIRKESNEIEEKKAFSLLQQGLIASLADKKQTPVLNVHEDQIVWGRSPVRIDLAGGWTDTPPYCLSMGGNVVNVAIELNGQPPLQVYVKPCRAYKIILRSIDLGAMEEVDSYDKLLAFDKIGSPFSIPKAALVLAGFSPLFSSAHYDSLSEQLKRFGMGMEITLLSAVPAGSGLGTSSILAASVLGALSDFCGLAWDKNEICKRTLVLEQLLTTGGGWQDQYGGVLQGVKLLQTTAGFEQSPLVRWLPDFLFTYPEYQKCHLLYYTGITRTAKGILAEIVKGMFLNSAPHLSLLGEMRDHAMELYDAIQRGNFTEMGKLVGKTWEQNKLLDAGTNPEGVEQIIRQVRDYILGCKLPGAGGGGYLYMVAKDPEAAARIRTILNTNPLNNRARLVEMTLSGKGLQISRS